jgi:hypothetical protein
MARLNCRPLNLCYKLLLFHDTGFIPFIEQREIFGLDARKLFKAERRIMDKRELKLKLIKRHQYFNGYREYLSLSTFISIGTTLFLS